MLLLTLAHKITFLATSSIAPPMRKQKENLIVGGINNSVACYLSPLALLTLVLLSPRLWLPRDNRVLRHEVYPFLYKPQRYLRGKKKVIFRLLSTLLAHMSQVAGLLQKCRNYMALSLSITCCHRNIQYQSCWQSSWLLGALSFPHST